MSRAFPFLLCVFVCGIALPWGPPREAWAMPADEVMPARAMGMGGLRAGAAGNDAIYRNPAALGAISFYAAQVDYLHSTALPGSDDGGDAVMISVGDSLSNPSFPTGISYRYLSLGPGGGFAKGWATDFALAVPLSSMFSLGGRLSTLSYREGDEDGTRFVGDLGGLFRYRYLQLGLVGSNLVRISAPSSARGLTASAALTSPGLWLIGADMSWDWVEKSPARSWTVGGEFLVGRLLPVRAGYESDGVGGSRRWSLGLGVVFRQFGLDVAFRQDLDTKENVWVFAAKLFGG